MTLQIIDPFKKTAYLCGKETHLARSYWFIVTVSECQSVFFFNLCKGPCRNIIQWKKKKIKQHWFPFQACSWTHVGAHYSVMPHRLASFTFLLCSKNTHLIRREHVYANGTDFKFFERVTSELFMYKKIRKNEENKTTFCSLFRVTGSKNNKRSDFTLCQTTTLTSKCIRANNSLKNQQKTI